MIMPHLKGTKEGFREASWNEAYDLIVKKFRELQNKYGKDSLSVFSGVSMTNEKCYLTGKFARVALGTRYIDYNGRFCMSSAAGGFLRSFGVDRGSTLPWTDIHETDCLFIAGSNTAECHPTSMFRVWDSTRKRRLHYRGGSPRNAYCEKSRSAP